MNFPQLETKRLILRAFEETDAIHIFNTYSLDEVTKYYDLETMKDISEAKVILNIFRSRFQERKGLRWAIQLKENGEYIGDGGFNFWDKNNSKSDIGYALMSKYWGKGLATEAVAAMLRFGFSEKNEIKLHRIEATTDPKNVKSRKLLIKLGFKEEGILRENCFEKGKFVDTVMHAILRREFFS